MKLDYGKNGIELEIDPNWNIKIIQPVEQFPIENPIKAIRDAINNPVGNLSLKTIINNKKKIKSVCIVVSDATRPVPTHLILEGLMRELNDYGIKEKDIGVLIATGLHRPSRKEEINRILGVISTSD